MKSKTLVAIGIGIGLGLMALIGGGEPEARVGQRMPASQRQMEQELQQLLARMGHDSGAMDPAEFTALVEHIFSQGPGPARHHQRAAASRDAMGQGYSAEDLLLLQGFVQMFAAQGYAGLGSLGYSGYSGGGSLGYGQSSQSGGSWSGDNYYSSRVGTGNYNTDNSAGYVYIPGTGSVSYGM